MIIEALIAFVLIFVSTVIIYGLGRRSAPKTTVSENAQASYACGEKATFHSSRLNINLYRYLIYFVIFDSAVLLLAFGSLSVMGANPVLFILYLGIILAAGLVLLEGGQD